MIVAQHIQPDGTVITFESYTEYEDWLLLNTPQPSAEDIIKENIRLRVKASIIFGKQLIEDFTVENTMLGIAQSEPSVAASLMINTEAIMKALETGSLYVAIAGIKALPVEAFDGIYLTAARALDFRNKIHVFLNLPTVQTYNQ